ncbi:hypothetical protein [Cellulomonas iranensis]|uniref:hypothetical protein n=1 Tax=Cellulomonas iranensis TaxID=76862 RepID=UPI000B3C0197|nr:hypothetical protein [Cellulomonas iranensis]
MAHEKRLLDSIGPLCEPLYDVFTNAKIAARKRHPEFVADLELRPVLTHVTRGLALYDLRGRDLGTWKTTPQKNAGIALSDGSLSIRVLHQLPDASPPPPGRNRVRRHFYSNPTLNDDFFPPGHNLLALWSETRSGLSFRIVRPVGTWAYGARHKVDLDFVLPAHAADLDSLVYETTDEDLVIVIPREEGEGGGERGITG